MTPVNQLHVPDCKTAPTTTTEKNKATKQDWKELAALLLPLLLLATVVLSPFIFLAFVLVNLSFLKN